jgi:hypothetical protein
MGPLQRAIADACLSADVDPVIALGLRAFLDSHGVAPEDVEAILSAPPRLAIYRGLVRNGLSGVVLRMLPRTRARMNALCAGRFDADFAGFVEQVGPRTHYLRDVPAELVAWAAPRWRSDPGVPPYLSDLAAYELAHFAVSACESVRAAPPLAEVSLDRPLAFAESVRLARYDWAVHELSAELDATDPAPRRDVCLLAYRDAGHAVRWLEVTPLAAAIVERLLSAEPLGGAVERACADHSTTPAAVLEQVARLLADLGERGVVIGARENRNAPRSSECE